MVDPGGQARAREGAGPGDEGGHGSGHGSAPAGRGQGRPARPVAGTPPAPAARGGADRDVVRGAPSRPDRWAGIRARRPEAGRCRRARGRTHGCRRPGRLVGLGEFESPKRVGLVHALANVATTVLFGTSWLARRRGDDTRGRRLALAGAATMAVGGYLGGHLSYSQGVGMNRNADEQKQPRGWTDAAADADVQEGRCCGSRSRARRSCSRGVAGRSTRWERCAVTTGPRSTRVRFTTAA